MMRDIKFRGLTLNNEWVYGLLCKDKKGTYISNSVGSPKAFEVRPDSVGQYTGLKENASEFNKEIYKGDIIEFISGERLSVEWNDDTCQFQYSDGSPINNGDRYATHKAIIGNIYDNPELIK